MLSEKVFPLISSNIPLYLYYETGRTEAPDLPSLDRSLFYALLTYPLLFLSFLKVDNPSIFNLSSY